MLGRGVARRILLPPPPSPARARLRQSDAWPRGKSFILCRQRLHHATDLDDTIYALSTAQGRAGIAVIRISGPSCLQIYQELCPRQAPLKPRRATVRTLLAPASRDGAAASPDVLDSDALLLYFPSPHSVTGEDVLELHVHGGPATVRAVLAALPRCRAAAATTNTTRTRYAEPGEFTRRAFLHDRLDLAQVESLGDTLEAETEQQRRAAVRGNSGQLGRAYEDWRQRLLLARGELEALIDFSEDQHFDESQAELLRSVADQVSRIMQLLQLHQLGGRRSELLRQGIRIALVGPPNAGKSSLMNMIAGREASIVSGEAGTTRDVVEARLDLGGYLCSFADTAGFRPCGGEEEEQQQEEEGKKEEEEQEKEEEDQGRAGDGRRGNRVAVGQVEREGIRRARQKAQEADVVVVVASFERRRDGGDSDGDVVVNFDRETLALAAEAPAALILVNKRDAVRSSSVLDGLVRRFQQRVSLEFPVLADAATQRLYTTSCIDGGDAGGGIQDVAQALVSCFSGLTDVPPDMQDLLGVTERQAQLMAKCGAHLDDFMREATTTTRGGSGDDHDADIVLAAEHLRFAADCLSRITGKGEAGDVEDVLGVVFEK
ncbi:GTP-binding protein TrmE [Moelleriella libera RCEF 2490]|uniref:GTP-binding protein TrmE n=1 Tax=Moelleriella libera RCEF 2490 TaxID=1081109 RepID=A0A168CFC2_9HYPO|nr:GTP-binding protein TrmE [Moelleriella libera RCEF 2490]